MIRVFGCYTRFTCVHEMCGSRNVQHLRANLVSKTRVTQQLLFSLFQDGWLVCYPHELHEGLPHGTLQVHTP